MARTVNKKAQGATRKNGMDEKFRKKLKPLGSTNPTRSKGELNRGQGTAKAKTTLDAYAKLEPLKTYKPKKTAAKKDDKLVPLKTYKPKKSADKLVPLKTYKPKKSKKK